MVMLVASAVSLVLTFSTARGTVFAPRLRLVTSETYRLKSSGGYTATISLHAYRAARITNLPPLPYSHGRSVSGCQVMASGERRLNPRTDAAVPFAFSATYTTGGFPSPLSVGLSTQNSDGNHPGEATFVLNGRTCFQEVPYQSVPGFFTNASLHRGQRLHGDFFLIVPDYYSPATPAGDSRLLRQICLTAYVNLSATPTVGQGLPTAPQFGVPSVTAVAGTNC
jgi:hypothetical protein